ncbi:MAG: DUF2147 domain-containing protein [Smithella sp.]
MMKKTFIFILAAFTLFAFSGLLQAADPSIAGVWSMPILKGKDKGQERLNVEIFEKDGAFYGRIVKISNAPANAVCTKCKDDKKDKPLMGMQVLRNLKKEAGRYVGGKIYDVDEGREYKCSLVLISPDKLQVTATFLFFSESHYWTRVK